MAQDERLKNFANRERLRRQLQKSEGRLKEASIIQKALNVTGPEMLKEGMSAPHVFEKYPHLSDEFNKGIQAESLLLMIDLSPFSSLVANWPPEQIICFLEKYYHIVVGRVSDKGGVVEKYIGDAVIAAFGRPFDETTSPEHLRRIINLSRSLIKEVELEFEGEVTAKCAIAYGICHYGYVGPSIHSELTIIGTPLTELFRLESDCPARSVILRKSLFEVVTESFPITPGHAPEAAKIPWVFKEETRELRGVGDVEVVIFSLES